MKPSTAALAASLEGLAGSLAQLAAALREEAAEAAPSRRKLSVVAKEKGWSASTMRELIARREITAVRVGLGRGHWMVDPVEVEKYMDRHTSRAAH